MKVSSFACKYVFYRPEHNARRGLHETEFWRSWIAKNEIQQWIELKEPIKKSGVICLVITVISWSSETDSLEGSLDRVLFAAELEFLKILVPSLPQHT